MKLSVVRSWFSVKLETGGASIQARPCDSGLLVRFVEGFEVGEQEVVVVVVNPQE